MRKFLHNCKRVIQIAKKPDKTEYMLVVKVTGLGILLVGFVGFVILLLSQIIGQIFPPI